MNSLRSSPLSFLSRASALHFFIFCCCGDMGRFSAFASVLAPRQSFRNALRSSPFSSFFAASALHVFILSCWAVFCARAGTQISAKQRDNNWFFNRPPEV